MAAKRRSDELEEPTEIHSSNQLNKILQQARAREAEEVNRDFEDYQEHTLIGNSQELAKQAMAMPDALPPLAISRSVTANVVKRATLTNLPAVRAQGSANELRPPPPAPTDDDAFGEWEGNAAAKPAPQAQDVDDIDDVLASIPDVDAPAVDQPRFIEARTELDAPVQGRAYSIIEESVEDARAGSVIELAVPQPIAQAKSKPLPVQKGKWAVRWGMVAWFALLAAMIGAGSMAYMKINRLEADLAAARVQLQAHH